MPLDAPNNDAYAPFVPAAVRRQAERADELSRGMLPAVAEVLPEENTTVVDDPPAAPPAPPAPPVVDWEQRYRTLQGKYDAEVPTLRGDLQRMATTLDGLREQVATAAAAPAAPAPAVSVPGEDIETYGEDLVTAARRWARAEVASELATLTAKMASLEQATAEATRTASQSQQLTTAQLFFKALDDDPEVGATWRVTNDDPAFLEWLNLVDDFSGTSRMAMLREAYSRNDARRAAAFFRAYHAKHTASPAASAPAPHTPTPGAGRPSLEDLATPGRGPGPAASGAPASERLWTGASITAFYRDRSKGAFRGREAEADRLEQDLMAATREGRIRN